MRGTGAGWRGAIAAALDDVPGLGFHEVIAESIRPGSARDDVSASLLRHDVVVHGVRLSLGSPDGLDPARVAHLAACTGATGAVLASEHVAFVRAGGMEAGHLLPLPRTREALDVLAGNVARTRSELDVPLALEPIAALFDWPDDEFDEAGFLLRLHERTGAPLLLDVANVGVNARNRGRDPRADIDALLAVLPPGAIAYCHVAGSADHDGLVHDTHTAPVGPEVLDLLAHTVGQLPEPPPVMLERDGAYPPAAELAAELAAIAAAAGHPSPCRAPATGVPS
ncbi:endonuclease [Pseudonocardia sp. HH130630-07]|nr:endonuclease [Pseudonocardia sp. HH130630-07]